MELESRWQVYNKLGVRVLFSKAKVSWCWLGLAWSLVNYLYRKQKNDVILINCFHVHFKRTEFFLFFWVLWNFIPLKCRNIYEVFYFEPTTKLFCQISFFLIQPQTSFETFLFLAWKISHFELIISHLSLPLNIFIHSVNVLIKTFKEYNKLINCKKSSSWNFF